MPAPHKATQGKRNRERALKEKQQEKDERRALRKEERRQREESLPEGVDPDLIGIVPGPQPRADD